MYTLKPRLTFEFKVEKVIGISADGRYQVQWAPAWVSKFHLVDCEHLIQEFLKEQMEREISLEREKQAEPEPGVQSKSQDVSIRIEGRSSRKNLTASEQCSDDVIPKPWSLSNTVTITDDGIDLKSRYDISNGDLKSDDPSKRFMTLMEGLLDSSSTEKEPSTLHPCAEEAEKLEAGHPPKRSKFSCASVDDTVQNSNTIEASNSRDHIVPESWERDDEIPLAFVRSSALKRTPKSCHSKKILRKNYMPILRKRVKTNQAKVLRPSRRHRDITTNKDKLHTPVLTIGNKRPYTCEVCKRSFKSSYLLKVHYRSHTDARPFACQHCGKSFKRLIHCKDHERLHTGEKPFPCQDCGKSFTSSSRLAKHRRHHPH